MDEDTQYSATTMHEHQSLINLLDQVTFQDNMTQERTSLNRKWERLKQRKVPEFVCTLMLNIK